MHLSNSKRRRRHQLKRRGLPACKRTPRSLQVVAVSGPVRSRTLGRRHAQETVSWPNHFYRRPSHPRRSSARPRARTRKTFLPLLPKPSLLPAANGAEVRTADAVAPPSGDAAVPARLALPSSSSKKTATTNGMTRRPSVLVDLASAAGGTRTEPNAESLFPET